MEKVTIIVPFYNVEAYIGECLNSIVKQTYNNLEILCIDDGSPDNSLDVVNAYAAKDDRIKVIRHEENKGLGGARNTGIKHASGDYLCFVDSDDYVSNRFVELLYQAISKGNSDVAVCGFWLFEGKDINKESHIAYKNTTLIIKENKDNVLEITKKIRGAS